MTHPLPDDLIRKDVRDLPEYNAGLALDRFRDAYGIDCVAKLDSNESPLGPSPRAIEVMREAAKGVARYPDAANTALRSAIARSTGAEADRIIVGNGSEDLIGALFRATIRAGDHVVTICPSFGLHEFGALTFGARVTKLPFEADWGSGQNLGVRLRPCDMCWSTFHREQRPARWQRDGRLWVTISCVGVFPCVCCRCHPRNFLRGTRRSADHCDIAAHSR